MGAPPAVSAGRTLPTPAFLADPAPGQARSVACEPGSLLTGPRRERSPHHTASPGFREITPHHPLHAAAKPGSQPVTGVCDLRLRRDEGEGGSRQGRGPRWAPGAGSGLVTPSEPHTGRGGVGNEWHLPAASALVLTRLFLRVTETFRGDSPRQAGRPPSARVSCRKPDCGVAGGGDVRARGPCVTADRRRRRAACCVSHR